MMWLVVPPVVGVLLGAAVLRWRQSRSPHDPQAAMQAAVDLHRIRRSMDVAWAKTELRRESSRLRRLMAEELDDTERR